MSVQKHSNRLFLSQSETICPFCSSSSTERIHRGWFVKNVVFWTNIKHYICHRCLSKFYKWKSKPEPKEKIIGAIKRVKRLRRKHQKNTFVSAEDDWSTDLTNAFAGKSG